MAWYFYILVIGLPFVFLGISVAVTLWLFKEFWRAKYAIECETKQRDELICKYAKMPTETIQDAVMLMELPDLKRENLKRIYHMSPNQISSMLETFDKVNSGLYAVTEKREG